MEPIRMRPRVSFAMNSNGLRDYLIDDAEKSRLKAIADIVSWDVLTEFDSAKARAVLAETTVLITGWGCPKIDQSTLVASPRLELIAHAAGSVKGHVAPECWEKGIRVTTAAQANALPVAEFTLAIILLAGKNLWAEQQKLRDGRSAYRKNVLDSSFGNSGATVGIIGASRIGRLLIDLLKPFSLTVLLADPTLNQNQAAELGVELVSLDELLVRSRVVSLHAPILTSTIGMIGARELALLQDGATFINTARGVLVDHDALRSEVTTGRITAVLDVTWPEPLQDSDAMYELTNVILTPHIAGSVGNELGKMGALAVDEVALIAQGAPGKHEISAEVLLAMA